MNEDKIPYLIIGGGKLASHLCSYFSMLGIEYLQWTRSSGEPPETKLHFCEKILLAIPDKELEKEIEIIYPAISDEQMIIHFSGALSFSNAESVHPLMSFSGNPYDLETYKSIPFCTIKGRKTFPEIFPELPNKYFEIEEPDKILYHALVSMAGNFTTILLKDVFNKLKEIGVAKQNLQPYLLQTLNNVCNLDDALTGPFSRKDFNTIELHKNVLRDSHLYELYDAFFKYYFERRELVESDN
ncbi:MAG: DUF2520 domain-containing protein [Ignavibacteria bacterium]|nr:MAG: DUF2520 domain-containing protein [Ignavibacteria bacterium]